MKSITPRCCVLASGSSGNAVYVEAGDTKILIDAGIGIKQLQAALAEIAVSGNDLTAIFVTHEHSDHIKGLSSVVKKWRLPVYASEGTWSQIARLWSEAEVVTARSLQAGVAFALGELVLEPFALSHDAEEPLGFCVYAGEQKLVLATDLGYASAHVKEIVRGAHTYILETNHDMEMLRAGSYPWHLKRRILGDKGHLSNAHAADFLLDVITEDTETVYMAHLSQENNKPQLAREALAGALQKVHKELRERVDLRMTSPKQPTALSAVRTGQELANRG